MHKPINIAFSVLLAMSCSTAAVFADQFYDAGLKFFQAKKYPDASRYFEQAIKNAPWESNAFYYCALSYHYQGDFKKAAEKYADCVERFPGTPASNSSLAALKQVDPEILKRRKAEKDAATASGSRTSGTTDSASSSSQDKGTIEGQPQTRVSFQPSALNDKDKVISDLWINGSKVPKGAIFDQNGADTCFSRSQLAAMGINPPKGATEFRGTLTVGGVIRKNFPITIDDSPMPAHIGSSFLDAFSVNVDDKARSIYLTRKGSASSGSGGTGVSFSMSEKNIMVPVEINGHGTQMIFDPNGGGELSFTAQQAKSIGLRVDDAEAEHKTAAELPQRGEPGWVPPEEQKTAKMMSVRMKFGPIERNGVTCKINEQGSKMPTFGADFISSGGYKFEIDYKTKKIMLTRK